jgi:protein Tex
LRDMVAELAKPGRDPRAAFRYATFRDDIREMRDLRVGMQLEGIVTNVANFGAFVDLGVHQDGLVHVSQLADRFVSDPKTIVKVGQVVQVRVLEVNEALKRISLSMRSESAAAPQNKPALQDQSSTPNRPSTQAAKPAPKSNSSSSAPPDRPASLADLQAKFGKKR